MAIRIINENTNEEEQYNFVDEVWDKYEFLLNEFGATSLCTKLAGEIPYHDLNNILNNLIREFDLEQDYKNW